MVVWTLLVLIMGATSYLALSSSGMPTPENLALARAANIGVMLVSLGLAYRMWWEGRNGQIGKLRKRIDELEQKVDKIVSK